MRDSAEAMRKFYGERVLSVHRRTESLFPFRTTRDPASRSPDMIHDTRALLSARRYEDGGHREAGRDVIEKAFVET